MAALLLMAIVIPVALEGVSIASRAGTLGQRKANAARIAQRVLNEAMLTGTPTSIGSSGRLTEENTTYEWTLDTEAWEIDALDVVTVRVNFAVQGAVFDVSVSTLYDPSTAAGASTTGNTSTGSAAP